MSTFEIIQEMQKEINNTVLNENQSVVQQIEKRRVRTVGNSLSSITSATRISTSKIATSSSTSGGEAKIESVLSSLYTSVECKDSILYSSESRKSNSFALRAGQNTIIHLDNYAEFMAQRASLKRVTVKRSEALTKEQEKLASPIGCVEAGGVDVVDVNLKVLIGGSSSSCCLKQTTNTMRRQKVQASANSKVQKPRNSLKIKLPKVVKNTANMFDIKDAKPDLTVLKKPRIKRQQKKVKNKQLTKNKSKVNSVNETLSNGKADKTDTSPKHFSRLTQTEREWKILKPCCSLLKNRKCATELTCPYLHSDFPCKYYYLSLPCPRGRKCQFMHNGPLAPRLIDALQTYILDLLSSKPSCAEIYFFEQMRQIDDIYKRLLSFEQNQQEGGEIIEVLDDSCEDNILNEGDEDDCNKVNNDTSTNTLINYSLNEQMPNISDKNLDDLYENFKEKNYLLVEIDQKLRSLKNSSNLTPDEKVIELQKIYEVLKEQENIIAKYDPKPNINKTPIQSNELNEETNLVLVHTDIENEIESQDLISIVDDENLSCKNVVNIISIENISPSQCDINTKTYLLNQTNNEKESPIRENVSISNEINETNLDNQNKEIENCNILSFLNTDNEIILAKSPETVTNDDHMPPISNENVSPIEIESISNEINEKHSDNRNNKPEHFNILPILNTGNASILTDSQETIQIGDKHETVDSNEKSKDEENYVEHNVIPLNETLSLNPNEKESPSSDNAQIENIVSPPTENIISSKRLANQEPLQRNRIRLRSHTHLEFDEQSDPLNTISIQESAKVKRRRLRLHKPNRNIAQKTRSECQINAEVINKLKESDEKYENKDKFNNIATVSEDEGVPLTQNVILSQRFIKKNKAKLDKIRDRNESNKNNHNKDSVVNIEEIMYALHNDSNVLDVNSTENLDVTLQTPTSDNSIINSSNTSLDRLIIISDADNDCVQLRNERPMPNELHTNLNAKEYIGQQTNPSNQVLPINNGIVENKNSRNPVSFENATSPTFTTTSLKSLSPLSIKQKFKLGNPHIVLTKLSRSALKQTVTKEMPADSTTTSSPLSNEKNAPKRRSLSPDNLDSNFKLNKCLKMSNSKNIDSVNVDAKNTTNSEQSGGDCDSDPDTEKQSIEDAINSSISATERKQALQPFSSQAIETLQNHGAQQHGNESDLRQQQIENASNKSDLQIQSHQQHEEKNKMHQEKAVETEIIAACVITNENSEYDEELEDNRKSSNEESDKHITNTCNPYGNVEIFEDGQQKSHTLQSADEFEKSPTSSKEYLCFEPISLHVLHEENREQVEYSKYSSLCNKLSTSTAKYQINFEDSSVNITSIASPTYGDDNAIASPTPVNKGIDFCKSIEIDGRLTYPPVPYILYEINLEKVNINRPLNVDRLKKTQSLDPRIFKPAEKKLVPVLPPVKANTTTESMLLPYDPRIRSSSGAFANVETPLSTNQNALACYNVNPTTLPYVNTDVQSVTRAVPLTVDYRTPQTMYPQFQQQQTPNMFLYGCLQRSPWYQSLMSTMKIQINQSISQLVRALNNFHRERLLNPTIVFDVFKIDCAGELMEIMRNLDIFIDSNGVINEKRHVPSFAGRCCHTMPVNTTYSFIQQVLTPNTHSASMTTTSSTYNASNNSGTMGSVNIVEPFVSCYVNGPDILPKIQDDDNCSTHSARSDDKKCSCNCKRVEHFNSNNNNSNHKNYNQNDKPYNQFRKPYDNNNNNNSHQQRSNQRSYNNKNNSRITKSSDFQHRSTSSPPNSPREGNAYENSNNYSGGGGQGKGGRFNNKYNRRSNNNHNNNTSSSWSPPKFSDGDIDKYQSHKSSYQSLSNSSKESSPISTYKQQSPHGSPIRTSPVKNIESMDDEECWD